MAETRYRIDGQEATREQVEQHVAAVRQRGARPGEGVTLCPACHAQGILAPLMLAASPHIAQCPQCQQAWTQEAWDTMVTVFRARRRYRIAQDNA